MNKSNEVLPMYHGYALGGIISKPDLEIPIYEKEKEECLILLNHIDEKIIKFTKEEKIQRKFGGKGFNEEVNQSYYNQLKFERMDLEAKLANIFDKLENLSYLKTFSISSTAEEMLPLNKAEIIIRNNSFPMERTEYLLLEEEEKQNVNSHENKKEAFNQSNSTSELKSTDSQNLKDAKVREKKKVATKVHNFIASILGQDANSTCLPQNSVKGVIRDIKQLLKQKKKVNLMGSFITLSRTKVIHKIELDDKEQISDYLKDNAKNYYVLTEAVLGGVFLGWQEISNLSNLSNQNNLNNINNVSNSSSSVDSNEFLFKENYSLFKFICQGAIPKMDKSIKNANLWSVYTSWKEKLQIDENTGYPIRFKYKELSDVLKSNGILHSLGSKDTTGLTQIPSGSAKNESTSGISSSTQMDADHNNPVQAQTINVKSPKTQNSGTRTKVDGEKVII